MSNFGRNLALWVIIALLLVALFNLFQPSGQRSMATQVAYSDFLNEVRAAKKAGRSVDEVANTWKIPARYKGYAEPQAARVRNNVALVYKETDAGVAR